MEERERERGWGRGRPPTPYARRPTQVVVAAYDATREHNEHELRLAVSGVLLRGGDTLLVLGVLHTVTNPMGYQTKACTDSFAGTSSRYLDEEVLKKVELYESRLLDSAEKCKEVGVTMKVKITAGTPTKMVVLQEVFSSKASWVILDRYLAPEYAEYGIVSVRTDVYAFGIVLFQLISGKRVLDEQGGQSHHILQWAEPLVESLALHELIDPRIGDSYDTYALYRLAKAAFLCVRRNPELRPSMGEVVRLLEAADDHARHLTQQFIPHYTK